MKLTDEQRQAVASEKSLYLSACPGSGKTRVIVAKLLQLVEEIKDTPHSIACITYTNGAVDEIETRLRNLCTNSLLSKCEVETIHSFCMHYILRPYSWLIKDIPKNFKILTQEMPEFKELVNSICLEVGNKSIYKMIDVYAGLRLSINREPVGDGIKNGKINAKQADQFWSKMREQGWLDFPQVLFYSYYILQHYEFVAEGIASRFPWFVIDEFQDTTDVQLELFKILHDRSHSQFFMVGDLEQSIQGFAGARPDLAEKFSTDIHSRTDMALSGSFRSSPQIVTHAQSLIDRRPEMKSVGDALSYNGKVKYIQSKSVVDDIINHFIPLLQQFNVPFGESAILAPWWTHLFPIAQSLRNQGIPVQGPGARPYKRSRLFSQIAEQLGMCVDSKSLSSLPTIEKSIFRLIYQAMGESRFDVFSYSGRCTSLNLVYEAKRIANENSKFDCWIKSCANRVAEILLLDGWIDQGTSVQLVKSSHEMIDDIKRHSNDHNSFTISDIGIFADSDNAIKLLTLHRSKGREFDAVAIIHAVENILPNWQSSTDDEINEDRRLFYVGVTRSRKCLLISSSSNRSNDEPSRFVDEAGLKI